ncbi:MAG: SDR family NAD(P)-dependent oxidoreductase, partial [Melioribacteraceae bacterium]
MDLNKKAFILFGSSGDLGSAAVNYFLRQEYDYFYFLARNDLNIPGMKSNCKLIRTGELTLEDNVINAFSEITKNNNIKYYLLNTIGGYSGGKNISETDYTDVKSMININLYTSFLIAKHFSLLVRGSGGGSICFISSLSSLKPETGKAAYNISKSALNTLVESLSLEGKEYGLSANAIAPYAIDTESNRKWMPDNSKLV